MARNKEIIVWIQQVPVINKELFNTKAALYRPLSDLFLNTQAQLKDRISEIFE